MADGSEYNYGGETVTGAREQICDGITCNGQPVAGFVRRRGKNGKLYLDQDAHWGKITNKIALAMPEDTVLVVIKEGNKYVSIPPHTALLAGPKIASKIKA